MGHVGKLPHSGFSTKTLRPRDQFEAWRESISVVFEATPLDPAAHAKGFKATVDAWHLGALLATQVSFDGQRFVRDRQRATADGLDHYLVQLYAEGGLVGRAAARERTLKAGDIQILDMCQSNVTKAEASKTVAVVVPRDTLSRALPKADDLHGLVLRGDGGTGALLGDYMRSLIERAPRLDSADAGTVADITTNMIAACFRPTAETLAQARSVLEITMLRRVQNHIATALKSSRLDADALSGLFRISRTRLYRMFEPLGGVAHYIQDQRLTAAYTELSTPSRTPRHIYEVAFDWGFNSEAHFSRAFRIAFGLSPSEVRQKAETPPTGMPRKIATPAGAAVGYEDWVRQLRRPAGAAASP